MSSMCLSIECMGMRTWLCPNQTFNVRLGSVGFTTEAPDLAYFYCFSFAANTPWPEIQGQPFTVMTNHGPTLENQTVKRSASDKWGYYSTEPGLACKDLFNRQVIQTHKHQHKHKHTNTRNIQPHKHFSPILESQSKPGAKMVYPESCTGLRRRPQLFMGGIVPY